MCTVLLPPGDNPIAVNKYIISYYSPSFALFVIHLSFQSSLFLFSVYFPITYKIDVAVMHAVTLALARLMTLAFYAGDRQPHTCWLFVKIERDFECPRELLNILCIKIWPHFFPLQTTFILKPRLVTNHLRLGSFNIEVGDDKVFRSIIVTLNYSEKTTVRKASPFAIRLKKGNLR